MTKCLAYYQSEGICILTGGPCDGETDMECWHETKEQAKSMGLLGNREGEKE